MTPPTVYAPAELVALDASPWRAALRESRSHKRHQKIWGNLQRSGWAAVEAMHNRQLIVALEIGATPWHEVETRDRLWRAYERQGWAFERLMTTLRRAK